MSTGNQVQGLDGLSKAFQELAKKATGSQLEASVRAGGLVIETSAKIKCPVLTGTLRSSIHTETRSTADGAEARIGTDVEYGPHVELGTSRQRAQAYLRPAFDENRERARQEVMDSLKEMVTP